MGRNLKRMDRYSSAARAGGIASAVPYSPRGQVPLPYTLQRSTLEGERRRVLKASENIAVHFHGLRHTFSSRALALGETLPVIGRLLDHSDIETTAPYDHLARDSVHEAAEWIAESIVADVL